MTVGRVKPANSTGIVLAGGRSRRMGRDKLGLRVGGMSLIGRVVEVLEAVCEEIVIVGDGGTSTDVSSRRVRDLRHGGQGPLAGLETGLSEATGSAVFLAAGDMPFLDRTLVRYLLDVIWSGADAAVPSHAGREHPVCAAYSSGVAEAVSKTLDAGEKSMKALLYRLDAVEYVDDLTRFGDPGKLLMNVNSPGDLEIARRLAGAGEGWTGE